MRELTGHKVNPANDKLTVTVLDEPGAGGACHRYVISGMNSGNVLHVELGFQNGPIAEAGVNGITHEVLLSILIDRMEGFQSGPYANEHNAAALFHLQTAQAELLARTSERMTRGVEGTMAV